jgi:hypothetical protein
VRLRAALVGLTDSLTNPERAEAVRQYLKHLDLVIERSTLNSEEKAMAFREDRQGLVCRGRGPGRNTSQVGYCRRCRSHPEKEHEIVRNHLSV